MDAAIALLAIQLGLTREEADKVGRVMDTLPPANVPSVFFDDFMYAADKAGVQVSTRIEGWTRAR